MATMTETGTLQALDFKHNFKCEGTDHDRGNLGHVPSEPGAYYMISPCRGPLKIQCAPRVAHMHISVDIYCRPCDAYHHVDDFKFIPVSMV